MTTSDRTIKRVNDPRGVIRDAITDTKKATSLATMGLQLCEGGIYVSYDKNHPKSSGGQANFLFQSDTDNVVRKYSYIYDGGTADSELDDMLDSLKSHTNPEVRKAITELEEMFVAAAVVLIRRGLENYTRLVAFLKEQAPEFVVTGREESNDADGRRRLAAFRIKYLPRNRGGKN